MLKQFWRALFKKPPVTPGMVMTFDDGKTDCPFERPVFKVEVLDVKDGWVRYRHVDTTFFQNEVMKLDSFRFCYKA